MAANPAVPFWDEGNTITCHASAAVTGKRFVAISGAAVDGNPSVASAAGSATTRAVGVSAYDAPAGTKVSVYRNGIVMPVTASGAIAAGALVYSAADGRATSTTTGIALGLCLTDTVDGADAPVALFA